MEACQEKLRSTPLDTTLIEEEIESREEYNRLQKAYTSFLQQKAKLDWGKEGDMNTSLYHASIKSKQQRSKVLSVVNEDNERIFEEEGIRAVLIEHFQKHFAARYKV